MGERGLQLKEPRVPAGPAGRIGQGVSSCQVAAEQVNR